MGAITAATVVDRPSDDRWKLFESLRACDALLAQMLGREPAPVAELALLANRIADDDKIAIAARDTLTAMVSKLEEMER